MLNLYAYTLNLLYLLSVLKRKHFAVIQFLWSLDTVASAWPTHDKMCNHLLPPSAYVCKWVEGHQFHQAHFIEHY